MDKQNEVEMIELLTDSDDEADGLPVGNARGEGQEPQATCLICYGEGPDVLQLECPGSHSFCGPCLTQWLTYGDPEAVLDGVAKLPYCPSCKAGPGPPGHVPIEVLPLLVARGHMSADQEARFHRQYVRLTTNDTIYACINPACDNQFVVDGLDAESADMVLEAFKVTCSSCSVVQCTACGVPWEPHAGLTCAAYKAREAPVDEATQKLLADSVPCPGKCGQGLQHAGGCNVLLCMTCKLYVCYLCGQGLDSSQVDTVKPGNHPTATKHYQVPGQPCYRALFMPKRRWLQDQERQRQGAALRAGAAAGEAGAAAAGPAPRLHAAQQQQQQHMHARPDVAAAGAAAAAAGAAGPPQMAPQQQLPPGIPFPFRPVRDLWFQAAPGVPLQLLQQPPAQAPQQQQGGQQQLAQPPQQQPAAAARVVDHHAAAQRAHARQAALLQQFEAACRQELAQIQERFRARHAALRQERQRLTRQALQEQPQPAITEQLAACKQQHGQMAEEWMQATLEARERHARQHARLVAQYNRQQQYQAHALQAVQQQQHQPQQQQLQQQRQQHQQHAAAQRQQQQQELQQQRQQELQQLRQQRQPQQVQQPHLPHDQQVAAVAALQARAQAQAQLQMMQQQQQQMMQHAQQQHRQPPVHDAQNAAAAAAAQQAEARRRFVQEQQLLWAEHERRKQQLENILHN